MPLETLRTITDILRLALPEMNCARAVGAEEAVVAGPWLVEALSWASQVVKIQWVAAAECDQD